VDARAAQRLRIVQRQRHTGTKFILAPRDAGDAFVAAVPGPVDGGRVGAAGRRVEQHLLQVVGLQAFDEFLLGKRIGKQVLHSFEAVFRGRLEAVEEGQLGVHHRQVGGKTGHGHFRLSHKTIADNDQSTLGWCYFSSELRFVGLRRSTSGRQRSGAGR
jgi:hypothetical protein